MKTKRIAHKVDGGRRVLNATTVKLFKSIRKLIVAARTAITQNINTLQVLMNYEIGKRIVEQEQSGKNRAPYGEQLLSDLSLKLSDEFGRGFSRSNLEYMRKFYLTYRDRAMAISQTPSGKSGHTVKSQIESGESLAPLKLKITDRAAQAPFALSWSQYVFLLSLDNPPERDFYEIESRENGWTLPELKRQFNSGLYERLALSRNKAGIKRLSKRGQIVEKPNDMLKEPYVLEFLGLDEKSKSSESDLEAAIISKIEHFLLELGKGFLFEARQKRFTFGEDHFFVDLVFFNRLLQCYVLIDLKIGKLMHQDIGQMQMYVNYYDRYAKQKSEKPTIGIILCREKHDALVEITLPRGANIHARQYQLFLPDKDLFRQKLLDWTKDQGGGK
jgi:predicted nuclease of restriction endonuclease-like (RecB) superfamily